MGVVYGHLSAFQNQHVLSGSRTWLHMPGAAFGGTGVDLFFVLSGFLITGILIRAREAVNYYTAFYVRRILRLAPLYYIAVTLTFCLHWVWPAARAYPASIQIWYWLDLSNFYSIMHSPNLPLAHFWTLAIEEQFYLVWPWLVLRSSNRALLRLALLMVPCQLALRLLPPLQALDQSFHGGLFYCFTLTHSEGLFAGAAVAILLYDDVLNRTHIRPLQALGGVCLAAACIATLHNSPGIRAFCPTLLCIGYTGLLASLVLQQGEGRLSTILTNRALRLAGRYSYCIYVVHIPILYFGWSHVFGLAPNRAAIAAEYVLALTLCLAIAAVSWRFIEEPMQAMKRQVPFTTGPLRHMPRLRQQLPPLHLRMAIPSQAESE